MNLHYKVMTVNERFEVIIKVLFDGNKRAFALKVGISPSVVENIVGARKGKPSFDVFEKVCSNANISAEWLLSGKGEMLNEKGRSVDTPALPVHDMASIDPVTHIVREQPAQDTVAAGLIEKLLDRITEQAAEIGRLQEQICQMRQRFEKDAANVNTDTIASVG